MLKYTKRNIHNIQNKLLSATMQPTCQWLNIFVLSDTIGCVTIVTKTCQKNQPTLLKFIYRYEVIHTSSWLVKSSIVGIPESRSARKIINGRMSNVAFQHCGSEDMRISYDGVHQSDCACHDGERIWFKWIDEEKIIPILEPTTNNLGFSTTPHVE